MTDNRMRKWLGIKFLSSLTEKPAWIQRQQFSCLGRPDPLDAADGGFSAQNGYEAPIFPSENNCFTSIIFYDAAAATPEQA